MVLIQSMLTVNDFIKAIDSS